MAACYACGAPTELENATREEREAVRSLSSVPGISEESGERARRERLPGLRRRRPARVARQRGPTRTPSHDRSEGLARGSRPTTAARRERGPLPDVRRGLV